MEVIIPIGYSFFERSKFNNPALQRLLTLKRKTILYTVEKWRIYEEKYEKCWAVIFAAMKEAQVVNLELDCNRFPGISLSLQGVHFSRLQLLNLENNNIVTIERLHELNMPQIKSVYLARNYITSVRAFRKNSYKKLEYLDLSNNKIMDLKCLSQFSNKALGKLLLEWQNLHKIGRIPLQLDKALFGWLR